VRGVRDGIEGERVGMNEEILTLGRLWWEGVWLLVRAGVGVVVYPFFRLFRLFVRR
jgi:hypothetical protein